MVITLIYVSSVGDLPVGGVHPVGVRKLSVDEPDESENQSFRLRRLLNSKVSQCTSRSLLPRGFVNKVFSSSDNV